MLSRFLLPFRRSLLLLCALFLLPVARAQVPAGAPPHMDRRVQACTLCHGKEGRATNNGFFPRIAGKPADYLYHQLLNFRDGRRNNDGMRYLLDHLNDDYLRTIALHFASLDLPYPPPPPPQGGPAELARGEALVRQGDPARELPACTACHGAAMTGVRPAVPGLLGLPRDYLIGQLGAWQTGLRKAFAPDCMAHVAQRLSPTDVAAVASWLAAQPLPANTLPAAPTAEALPLRCGLTPPVAGAVR
jgi:cytochrome c553